MTCIFCKEEQSNKNETPVATLYCKGKYISDAQCVSCLSCIRKKENTIKNNTYGDKYLMCPGCNSRILSYSYTDNSITKFHSFDTNENILNYFSGTGGLKFSS